MKAGSLAGLLNAGLAAASPADTPPSFDVEEKMSLEGGVVWYNVVLREPAKLTRKIVRVRWSQMEALSKALHSADGMPGFPDSVYVERKFFKTSDPDKLESRRLEVKVFFEQMMDWAQGCSRMEELLEKPAILAFLKDCEVMKDEPPRATPAITASERELIDAVSATPDSPAAARSAGAAESPGTTLYSAAKGEQVSKRDFEIIATLGEGSYGKVALVRKKGDGKLYAMKVLNKADLRAKGEVEHTKAERNILASMTGIPFTVDLYYAFQSSQSLYLVLDFMQGGELFFHLRRQKRFPEAIVRFYAAQMVVAIEQIHMRDVIYRDLKPENVLLGADGYICLTDFGLSKERVSGNYDGVSTLCGTAEYMAPEMIGSDDYGKSVDWWSLGTLLYEMLHGLPPFYSKNRREMAMRITTAKLTFPDNFSASAREVLSGLLDRDPIKRFDAAGMKGLSFFKGVDWVKLMNKEYEPPIRPKIEHELDLSNFDNEFTEAKPNFLDSVGGPGALGGSDTAFAGFTFKATDFSMMKDAIRQVETSRAGPAATAASEEEQRVAKMRSSPPPKK